jgi:hypothetical protein
MGYLPGAEELTWQLGFSSAALTARQRLLAQLGALTMTTDTTAATG